MPTSIPSSAIFVATWRSPTRSRRACTFVELEDAGPRSLFVKHGDKSTREWSPRFDHGYSQVVDWFHKLQDMTHTATMEARFGKRAIDYTGCWSSAAIST